MWFLSRLWEFTLQYSLIYNGPDQVSLGSIESGRLSTGFLSSLGKSFINQNCVNSPQTRSCWHGDFNISTDYERVVPDGQIRKYDLVISNQIIAPDGYSVSGMIINGSYPGPTIEGDWGDTFEITVHNNLTNHNGTSIHWHGIRQLNTNWEDGVAGVTQCPIPPGQSYTYKWRAMQYGTSWYHSHFSLQYPDGIAGPLKINGPTSMNYDIDLGHVLISDWYHADAFSLFDIELNGAAPVPDSNILNGKGNFTCTPGKNDPHCTGKQPRAVFNFTDGEVYKMSIVNTATATHFTFWIDGHDFSVVSTDFVPIKPYDTDTINVAIGQRYDIIVKANASMVHGSNFWIHARDCTQNLQYSPLGIIRYDSSSTLDPYTPPGNRVGYGCQDEPNPKPGPAFVPVVPRHVGKSSNPFGQDEALEVGNEGYPNISDIHSRIKHWVLADSSLYLDWEVPSLSLISQYGARVEKNFPPSYAPIVLDYDDDEWVYFLIEGNFTKTVGNRYDNVVNVAHPIHLHGHDFVVLGQGNSTFNATTFTPNLNNPTRRDVAMLPIDGYLVIAFQMGNPGAWLMHCHIAWHASNGLALQYIEQPQKITPLIKKADVLPTFNRNCVDWSLYYNLISEPNNATQTDSGI